MTTTNKIMAILAAVLISLMLADVVRGAEIEWENGFDVFTHINQECAFAVSNSQAEGIYSNHDAIAHYFLCMKSGYEFMYNNAIELIEESRSKL